MPNENSAPRGDEWRPDSDMEDSDNEEPCDDKDYARLNEVLRSRPLLWEQMTLYGVSKT